MLAPLDGGQTARILKAGKNGAASTLAADIAVDFKGGKPFEAGTGTQGQQAIADVAFVMDGKRNFVLIAGSVDNDLVIADMDDEYRTIKISFSANTEATAAGNRQLEWAVGSDYVWINGGQTKEMYIIKLGATIDDTRLIKTLTDMPDGKVSYVENYAKQVPEAVVQVAQAPSVSSEIGQQPATATRDQAADIVSRSASDVEVSAAKAETVTNEDSTTQAIAIAGLIVASLALLGVMALVASSALSKPLASAAASNIGAASGAADDVVTLGSKNVA